MCACTTTLKAISPRVDTSAVAVPNLALAWAKKNHNQKNENQKMKNLAFLGVTNYFSEGFC